MQEIAVAKAARAIPVERVPVEVIERDAPDLAPVRAHVEPEAAALARQVGRPGGELAHPLIDESGRATVGPEERNEPDQDDQRERPQ